MATKEEVIDYVMTTPNNPNRAVLEGMLNSIAEAGGGGSLVIRLDNEASTAEKVVYDKTWQEVYDALKNGTRVIILAETTLPPGIATISITTATNNTTGTAAPYQVYSESRSGSTIAIADTADGYLYESVSGGGTH